MPQSRPSSWEAVGKSRSAWTSQPIRPWSLQSTSSKRPGSTCSTDSGYPGSLERSQSNSSITTSADPEISGSGEDPSAAADNKWPQSLSLAKTPKKQGMLERFCRQLSIRRSKSSYAIGKTTKDILQLDEEMFSSFSPGMQKILSLPLSLDMMRCLFPVLSTEKQQERLISYACSQKVKTNPKEIEQRFSSLLTEEREICSLLFFPEKERKMYVGLSPRAKEQLDLFWKVLGRVQEITSDSGYSSGLSASPAVPQGSVSSKVEECNAQRVKANSLEHT